MKKIILLAYTFMLIPFISTNGIKDIEGAQLKIRTTQENLRQLKKSTSNVAMAIDNNVTIVESNKSKFDDAKEQLKAADSQIRTARDATKLTSLIAEQKKNMRNANAAVKKGEIWMAFPAVFHNSYMKLLKTEGNKRFNAAKNGAAPPLNLIESGLNMLTASKKALEHGILNATKLSKELKDLGPTIDDINTSLDVDYNNLEDLKQKLRGDSYRDKKTIPSSNKIPSAADLNKKAPPRSTPSKSKSGPSIT